MFCSPVALPLAHIRLLTQRWLIDRVCLHSPFFSGICAAVASFLVSQHAHRGGPFEEGWAPPVFRPIHSAAAGSTMQQQSHRLRSRGNLR